jgi:hypothetical protein
VPLTVAIWTGKRGANMAPMKVDKATWAKWQEWTRRIEADLARVVDDQATFDQFRSVVEENAKWLDGNSGAPFIDLIKRSYAAAAFMGIRRQLKVDDQSISLVRLLKQLAEGADQVTLDRYKELQDAGTAPWDWRKAALEELADESNPSVISRQKVEADIARVRQINERIEELADRVVAHHDKRGSEAKVSFDDLRGSIGAFDQIVQKYIVLFTGNSYSGETLKANVAWDWKKIFRTPWIKPDA